MISLAERTLPPERRKFRGGRCYRAIFAEFERALKNGKRAKRFALCTIGCLSASFWSRLPMHSAIAVGASRNYSWLVEEMERAGHRPKLCNPLEAKWRRGLTDKTDKLDARGLAILLRNGTLPEVWIPL